MSFERASGILLHPTSLPSRGGIGDLGPAAYEFLDFLAAAKQSLWQVLPLGPAGYGNSPYSGTSAFAGNPLLISLERLAERGWIAPDRLPPLPLNVSKVDYEQVRATKLPSLREAARNFLSRARSDDQSRFHHFCQDNRWWLEDFVLFDALREKRNYESWNRWPRGLARREPEALDQARHDLASELDIGRVLQFACFEQWRAVHRRCTQLGIRVIGDVAIFVSYDSADVWTYPELFYLNEELEPSVVAGVPPDAFSATGQRWGNPLYRWDVLKARGYDWWVRRLRWALNTCDILRLDHFLGFERYWEIPAQEPTAIHGRWVEGPKDDFFHAISRDAGQLPFIAEDLGLVTPEAGALRQRLNIPGMKVLQFGFDDRGAHIYLPHQCEPNYVVYTGTHDNDTMAGWWQTRNDHQRRQILAYLGGEDSCGIPWAFVRAAETSVARLCVIPLQDVLGLGNEARMNVPSQPDGNWTWRFSPGVLTAELAARLGALTEICDRDRPASAAHQQSHGEMGEEFAA
jgi:4-alpha-glucanotransferase